MSSNDSVEPEAVSEGLEGNVELESQVDALAVAEAKASEYWDRLLRLQAEMDNLKRRSVLDVEKAHKFALGKFVDDLIPVKDSLEMGLDAEKTGEGEQAKTIIEGMEMTLKMLGDVLAKHGVEEVNPVGEKFNPERHQAMTMLESPDHEPSTVMTVMQKGYVLNDRLVRPAMVVVAK